MLIAALAAASTAAPPRPDVALKATARGQVKIQVLAGYRLMSTPDGLADRRSFRTISVASGKDSTQTLRVVEFE